MKTFEKVADVAAPPDLAWQVLADVARWPGWTASMTRVEPIASSPLGVGSKVRVEQPGLRPIVLDVVEWRPGRSFAWEGRQPGVRVFADHTLTPTPDGCRLTLKLEYRGLLGAVVGLLARRLTDRYMTLEAEGFKRRCEAMAASR